jgi:GTP-binding protein EngB required for normal cell division
MSPPNSEQVGSSEGIGTAGTSSYIVVVGDDSADEVALKLSQQGLVINQALNSADNAAAVVVAVDATAGIRDVHRDLVRQLPRNSSAPIIWLFTKMSQINDKELMDLQQTEALDLFQPYEVLASRVQFAVDTEQTSVRPDVLKGWTALNQFLSDSCK